MEPTDDNSAQNSALSESLQTVPIYNLDASSSDSDSDDPERRGGPPVGPPIDTSALTPATSGSQVSTLSQRQRVQVPQRSYTTPLPKHERQLSELSAVAESVQTRPSVDEENFFEDEEDSTSEEEPFQSDIRLSSQTETPITAPQMVEHTVVDISSRTDNRGLRPLSLLSENVEKGLSSQGKASYDPKSRGIPKEMMTQVAEAERSSDTGGYRRLKEPEHMYHHRESSDLLPLTLVSEGTTSGLSYSANYAYLSPPFGRVINRSQIMARVAWFSQLIIFNIVYAEYKLNSTTIDGKTSMSNLIGLVIIPLTFLVAYILLITVWTYIDLKNKGFDTTFTTLYYSPLMIFSIFFEEKKRVDASKFHEVNYGAKWWKFGTTRVREGLIMSFYCLFVIGFVTSDILGRAFNQRNAEVSKVFEDVVPFLFMLIVFSFGFIVSIWAVVEAIVAGSMHGSGEGNKRLVGVIPNAFKTKEYYK
ncbi:hypothetical protein C1645_733972 [Glomus cerebriforme]|uniref:Uncharacterized protein n=1 Tax=Glomus cerebriforme TaxID=658196 RepID=A0A397TKQ7_9GLOM|nr:hypothetical protein C1645_733972 [Glomus cerebriforme]